MAVLVPLTTVFTNQKSTCGVRLASVTLQRGGTGQGVKEDRTKELNRADKQKAAGKSVFLLK